MVVPRIWLPIPKTRVNCLNVKKIIFLAIVGVTRRKISFLGPVSRENFANALGQTCIHDLRLRHDQMVFEK